MLHRPPECRRVRGRPIADPAEIDDRLHDPPRRLGAEERRAGRRGGWGLEAGPIGEGGDGIGGDAEGEGGGRREEEEYEGPGGTGEGGFGSVEYWVVITLHHRFSSLHIYVFHPYI